MIKIKIDAATGAEARLELLNLLGIAPANSVAVKPPKAEPGEIDKGEPQPDTEVIKSKRRSKAEIEADKKTTEAQPEISETLTQDNADQNVTVEHPSLQDLQRMCAILVRAGFKQQGIDFIKNIGNADTSKDVAEDKRQPCIEAMTKFAEENKIAV